MLAENFKIDLTCENKLPTPNIDTPPVPHMHSIELDCWCWLVVIQSDYYFECVTYTNY